MGELMQDELLSMDEVIPLCQGSCRFVVNPNEGGEEAMLL